MKRMLVLWMVVVVMGLTAGMANADWTGWRSLSDGCSHSIEYRYNSSSCDDDEQEVTLQLHNPYCHKVTVEVETKVVRSCGTVKRVRSCYTLSGGCNSSLVRYTGEKVTLRLVSVRQYD